MTSPNVASLYFRGWIIKWSEIYPCILIFNLTALVMTKWETAQPQKLKIKLLKKTLKYFTMKLNYETEMICRIRERLQFITMLGEKEGS